ncbi:hypothetical protein HDU99_004496 [Rhizoclosmatium hyalinum]|nr:hypothetical protein HDU99_004496 [Rhizoclosmatium hyalinum]
MTNVTDDLTPYYALKSERIHRIATLLSHNLILFEQVGFPPDSDKNPLIQILKDIGAKQAGPHLLETTVPVARAYLDSSLATYKFLPRPLSLTPECLNHLEAMEAALLKVVQTQQAATESQTEYARRLAATKEAAEKACAESESLMEKKVDEISKKMVLLDTETQKYKQLAIEAEAARVALELKSKEEEEATKARIKELRNELLDLANDEMQLTDGMSKAEIMALLEDLIGEKVSRINRLAAVSAEFYKLLKTLHFPASDPLTPFLQTLPTNLPDNANRRALQLRAKQIFVASLNSPSKSLPPPFAFTRAYIEALEDRRDDVRDQVMEQEAKESDCKRVVDEIAKLYENLNIPKQDRNALVLDIKNLDEYNILVQELREKWEAGKQGEVDMSRLQEFREELTDLKANEFVVVSPASS